MSWNNVTVLIVIKKTDSKKTNKDLKLTFMKLWNSNNKSDDSNSYTYTNNDENSNRDKNDNVPRRQPSNSNGRCRMSLSRGTVETASLSRRQSLSTLNCNSGKNQREARRKHRVIARKHYPGKWCTEWNFSKEGGMKIFKGAASAHELLVPQNLMFLWNLMPCEQRSAIDGIGWSLGNARW